MSKANVYNRLMDAIGNAFGVCGLMANIDAESGFKSTNMQNSYEARLGMDDTTYTLAVDSGAYTNFAIDRVGYGLCQWTSSGRKAGLLAFAKEHGKSIGDEDMQIDYLLHELSTGYKKVLEVLKNATSVKEASDYVCTKYERPADQSEKALANRAKKGEAIFAEFANNDGKEDKPMKIYKKGVAVQLAKNFKSTEFDCNGKGCCSETPISTDLVKILQQVRDHFGVPVNNNCAYRCPEHNAKVSGASKNSKHMDGIAADIVVKGVHPMRVARYIETLPEFRGRLGVYTWNDKGDGFVHVDVRGTNSRGIYTENNTDYDTIPSFHVAVKKGMKGKIVKVVQRKLRSEKLYFGLIDGSCGKGTTAGIMKFNAKHGRLNDASWGKKCWNEAFPIEK